jgi:alanine-glyoxylate transaminase/serine-glyoxylate transaminase/serine-pyruvate transaminase
MSAAAAAVAPSRPLLMIPGPIEFHPDVLAKLGEATPGHVSPGFLAEFSSALTLLRQVFDAPTGQPFVIAGSGTLGWEAIAANLLEKVDHGQEPGAADVLVVSTGYFSDSWKVGCRCHHASTCGFLIQCSPLCSSFSHRQDTFETFGFRVAQVQAPAIGDTVTLEALQTALKANPSVRMVAITHVDTSTAVLNDVKSLSAAVKAFRSDILVAVDGVCSIGGEVFHQEAWGIDAAMTGSQKALGAPPGLAILVLSAAAVKIVENRKTRIPVYYGNLARWLPIMRAYESKTPSYFATPAVNLIRALNVALGQIVGQGLEARFEAHRKTSDAFKAAITALGLKQVPTAEAHRAHTLSAIYFPTGDGIDASKLLPAMTQHGIVAAGGLHKDIKATYFRVGRQ